MTRISNGKIIKDPIKHTNLLDEYVDVIEHLQKKFHKNHLPETAQ